jgi:hypothetical protein
MVDPTPDPIDQAYRDAETLLTEQAERSARRARILAAVAQDKAVDPVERQTLAPGFSSRYGWLVAASVMLVSGYLILRFLPSHQLGSPPSWADPPAHSSLKPFRRWRQRCRPERDDRASPGLRRRDRRRLRREVRRSPGWYRVRPLAWLHLPSARVPEPQVLRAGQPWAEAARLPP